MIRAALCAYVCFQGCSKPSTVADPTQHIDQSESAPTTDSVESDSATQSAPNNVAIQTTKIRVATYNGSLHRKKAGDLVKDLIGQDNQQARKIAEIIQRVRPDVLLINEIDFQEDGAPPRLLRDNYFSVGQSGLDPIDYPYIYAPSSNTGTPSGMDLDLDGKTTGPGDAFGFGQYPGQYAFAVFSCFPIVNGNGDAPAHNEPRSFQTFLWSDMPDTMNPRAPGSEAPYYPADIWKRLRLSSKNHCDVPIRLPNGRALHFLVCHPTPPVFDNAEDRNGARNSAEIRFWTDYISGPESSSYIYDDAGTHGGLAGDSFFVIAGDLNSDPADGDSRHQAINGLLHHGRVTDPSPKSDGGLAASENAKRNQSQSGDPRNDTSKWSSGNLRVDYVLPSSNCKVHDAGVFWPSGDDPLRELINASDHRLVWVDVEL